jgi:hypothetical protein
MRKFHAVMRDAATCYLSVVLQKAAFIAVLQTYYNLTH